MSATLTPSEVMLLLLLLLFGIESRPHIETILAPIVLLITGESSLYFSGVMLRNIICIISSVEGNVFTSFNCNTLSIRMDHAFLFTSNVSDLKLHRQQSMNLIMYPK